MAGRHIARFGIMFLIVLGMLRILGYAFARRLARPLETISETAAAVAGGDLSQKAQVTSSDEIGELAANFNVMIEGLREREKVRLVEFELEKGRRIQQEFLPARIPAIPEWDISAMFYPAKQVSGDFYDVFTLPGGLTGLAIGDVCDKGVGSALYMALFRSLIRVFSAQALSDRFLQNGGEGKNVDALEAQRLALSAVSETNAYIAENHGNEGMFATLFFGVLHPESGRLLYINAGHEPLLLLRQNGEKTLLKKTGPAVGVLKGIPYQIDDVEMERGDTLVGYTDGVTEARSPDDTMYTRKRLLDLLGEPVVSATAVLESIRNNLFEFVESAPRNDDVTMLAVQRNPA
jgi:serine phosphatase RsbU (regulator of sigma subunit)